MPVWKLYLHVQPEGGGCVNKVVVSHHLYIFSQECYYIEGRKSVAFPYSVAISSQRYSV